MANINWRTVIATVTQLPSKLTVGQILGTVVVITALAAATVFWVSTLDGVPAVGYYRLGVTIAVAGAVIAWVTRLHHRCRRQAARIRVLEKRMALIEREHDELKEDAHIRKVLKRMRERGHLPLVDN